MLKKFLDPKTANIGDRRFLDIFLRLLKDINPEVDIESFRGEVTVACEDTGEEQQDGRVDVLISSATSAIIIENKINDAVDQDNQLARYMKIVDEHGLKVAAVVYLPKFEYHKPPLDYDDKWQEYVPEIEKKLVVLPAIDSRYTEKVTVKNRVKDLSVSFIGECLKLGGLTEVQKYILSQYAAVLHIIGEAKMTDTIDKEFIKDFTRMRKA